MKSTGYIINKTYSQSNSSGDLNPSTFSVEESWHYSITYRLYTTDNYTYGHTITSEQQGQLASQTSQPRSYQTLSRSGDLTAWDTLTFSHWWVTIKGSSLQINYAVTYAPAPVVKAPLVPLDKKDLWGLCKCFSFWLNPKNDVFEWWLVVGQTNSVTTGSIALGNAVWYLVINYNWNLVKVPYYT